MNKNISPRIAYCALIVALLVTCLLFVSSCGDSGGITPTNTISITKKPPLTTIPQNGNGLDGIFEDTAADITIDGLQPPTEDTYFPVTDDSMQELVTTIVTSPGTTRPILPPITTKPATSKPIVVTTPVEDTTKDAQTTAPAEEEITTAETTSAVPNIQGEECTEEQLAFYNEARNLFSVMLLNVKNTVITPDGCEVEYIEWRCGTQSLSKFTALNPASGNVEECYRLRVQAKYFGDYSILQTICEIPVFVDEFNEFSSEYLAIPKANRAHSKIDINMCYTADMFTKISEEEMQALSNLFNAIIDNFPAG